MEGQPPGHVSQWSAPINPLTLAYNMAHQDNNPANFWSNVKFWHDFLTFVNNGVPQQQQQQQYHTDPSGYTHPSMYPHDASCQQHGAPCAAPQPMYASEYQQYHPTPGYPVQFSNEVTSHDPLGSSTLFNDIFGNHQYESSQVLGDPAHCHLRHNCPGFMDMKAPMYYVPPMSPLAGLLGPSAANIQSLFPGLTYPGAVRSLPMKTLESEAMTNPYIRPSMYRFLTRKKPLERFMKRPIIQGRYADPLLQQLQSRTAKTSPVIPRIPAVMPRLPAVGKPIIRTMTPLTLNAMNRIKALRAQYGSNRAQAHVGVPVVGSPLLRRIPVPRNPYLTAQKQQQQQQQQQLQQLQQRKLQQQLQQHHTIPYQQQQRLNPYAMASLLQQTPQLPWSLGTLQSRYPHFGYPVLPPPPLRKRGPMPPIARPKVPPLLKKATLPRPLVKKRGGAVMGVRKGDLPPRPNPLLLKKKQQQRPSAARANLQKRLSLARANLQEKLSIARATSLQKAAVARATLGMKKVPAKKKDPSLVGIWDKIYRFYTHNGKDAKISVPDAHEISLAANKSPPKDAPKGIAVIEKFLQSKIADKNVGGIGSSSSGGEVVDIVGGTSSKVQDDAPMMGAESPASDISSNIISNNNNNNNNNNNDDSDNDNNDVKTGVPVLRVDANKVQTVKDNKFANGALLKNRQENKGYNVQVSRNTFLNDTSSTENRNDVTEKSFGYTNVTTPEDTILKSISSTPHSWDKRGKVTFAISKKTDIPGRPRVTGVWGSLKRKRRKNKKKKRKKKRSLLFTQTCSTWQQSYLTNTGDMRCLPKGYEIDYG